MYIYNLLKLTVCLEVMEIAAGGYAETKVTLYSFEFGVGWRVCKSRC